MQSSSSLLNKSFSKTTTTTTTVVNNTQSTCESPQSNNGFFANIATLRNPAEHWRDDVNGTIYMYYMGVAMGGIQDKPETMRLFVTHRTLQPNMPGYAYYTALAHVGVPLVKFILIKEDKDHIVAAQHSTVLKQKYNTIKAQAILDGTYNNNCKEEKDKIVEYKVSVNDAEFDMDMWRKSEYNRQNTKDKDKWCISDSNMSIIINQIRTVVSSEEFAEILETFNIRLQESKTHSLENTNATTTTTTTIVDYNLNNLENAQQHTSNAQSTQNEQQQQQQQPITYNIYYNNTYNTNTRNVTATTTTSAYNDSNVTNNAQQQQHMYNVFSSDAEIERIKLANKACDKYATYVEMAACFVYLITFSFTISYVILL